MAFCQMINLYIYLAIIFVCQPMAIPDQNIDRLYKKLLRYEHNRINYSESLLRGITPFGLCIKQRAQITPVSIDFQKRWDEVLYEAERKLVTLLHFESENVRKSSEPERDEYERFLSESNREFKNCDSLESRRQRKWLKFTHREQQKKINDSLQLANVYK